MNPTKASKRSPLRLSYQEIILVIFTTFPVMGTLFPVDTYLGDSGSSLARIVVYTPLNTTLILCIVLFYIIFLFMQSPQKAMDAFRRNWLLFVFLLWCFITTKWAPQPGISFNRVGRMLVFTLYALYIVEYVPYKRSLQLFAICLFISSLASLFMIVALPSFSHSIEDLRGAWRGAMLHKNVLGSTAATALLVALAAWRMRLFNPYFTLTLAGISTILMVFANSATALLGAVVVSAVLIYLIYIVNRVRNPLVFLFFSVAIAGALALIVISSGIIFTLLGRDSGLTGRSDIWEFVQIMIDQNPFWGYGVAVWSSDWFQYLVMQYIHWPAPHAHNAWLDFRLQLGLPGLILAIAIWGLTAFRMLYAISVWKAPEMALAIGLFLLLSIRSYAETIVVDPSLNDMFWLAFAYASLAALPMRQKMRQRSSASHAHSANFRNADGRRQMMDERLPSFRARQKS